MRSLACPYTPVRTWDGRPARNMILSRQLLPRCRLRFLVPCPRPIMYRRLWFLHFRPNISRNRSLSSNHLHPSQCRFSRVSITPSPSTVAALSDIRYGNMRVILLLHPPFNLHARQQYLKSESTEVSFYVPPTIRVPLLRHILAHTSTPLISTTRILRLSNGNQTCITCPLNDRAKRVVPTRDHTGHPDNRPLDSTRPYSCSRFAPY